MHGIRLSASLAMGAAWLGPPFSLAMIHRLATRTNRPVKPQMSSSTVKQQPADRNPLSIELSRLHHLNPTEPVDEVLNAEVDSCRGAERISHPEKPER